MNIDNITDQDRNKNIEKLRRNRPQLLRIISSANDFQMSLSALTWFMEELNSKEKFTELQIRKMRCFESVAVIAFCRPFIKSRSQTSLSRKLIGVTFSSDDEFLFQKLKRARNNYIAHSDEEGMHFLVDSFPISVVNKMQIPHMTFDNGLLLTKPEYYQLEDMLHGLLHAVHAIIWEFTQRYPKEIKMYKQFKNQSPNRA